MWKSYALLSLTCALILNITPTKASQSAHEELSAGYLAINDVAAMIPLSLLEAKQKSKNAEMVEFIGFALKQMTQSENDKLNQVIFAKVLRPRRIADSFAELASIIDIMYKGFVNAVGEEFQFTETFTHSESESVGLTDTLLSAEQEFEIVNERNIVGAIVDILLDSDDGRFEQIIYRIIKSSDTDEVAVERLYHALKVVFIESIKVRSGKEKITVHLSLFYHDNDVDSNSNTEYWTIELAPRVWGLVWAVVITSICFCAALIYTYHKRKGTKKKVELVDSLDVTLLKDGEN